MPDVPHQTRILPVGDPQSLALAGVLLGQGAVIAFPTDTVYGLGCTYAQPGAVEQLYTIKQRPLSMAIPLLVASQDQVEHLAADLNDTFRTLAAHFWPGELTLVVHRHPSIPDIITAGGDTVALRMPNHAGARKLCRMAGGALAATSANLSGEPAGTTAEEVSHSLAGRIPLILDGGRCPGGVASTIIDCIAQPPRILRLGNLKLDVLQKLVPTLTA